MVFWCCLGCITVHTTNVLDTSAPSTPVFSSVHCSNVNRAQDTKDSTCKTTLMTGSWPISTVNEHIKNSRFWWRCLTTILCLSRIWHRRLHSKRVNLPTAERAKLGVPCCHVKNKPRGVEQGTLTEEEMSEFNMQGMLGMGTLPWLTGILSFTKATLDDRINTLWGSYPILAVECTPLGLPSTSSAI